MPELQGIDLSDAISDLRNQLEKAQAEALESHIEFAIRTVTIELQLVATREAGGKGGFKVPFIDFELGAEAVFSRESTHKLVIELNAPVDRRTNQPVKVADSRSTELD